MLFPNYQFPCKKISEPILVYVMARYAPWHVVVLQDSTRCSCVLSFILASLGRCSDFYFFLLAILISSQDLGKNVQTQFTYHSCASLPAR